MSGAEDEIVHFAPEQQFREVVARLFQRVKAQL
jgi:hypothetical protein